MGPLNTPKATRAELIARIDTLEEEITKLVIGKHRRDQVITRLKETCQRCTLPLLGRAYCSKCKG